MCAWTWKAPCKVNLLGIHYLSWSSVAMGLRLLRRTSQVWHQALSVSFYCQVFLRQPETKSPDSEIKAQCLFRVISWEYKWRNWHIVPNLKSVQGMEDAKHVTDTWQEKTPDYHSTNTKRQTTICLHIYTSRKFRINNYPNPTNCLPLNCGRIPEDLDRTHADTWEEHANSSEVTVLSTAPPCCFSHLCY